MIILMASSVQDQNGKTSKALHYADGHRWIAAERLAGFEEVLMIFCYFVLAAIPKLVC